MIALEDCIGLCGLTEEEVLAIAEHEHLPEIAATALAQYLLSHEHGSEKVRDMIVDDFRQAQLSGDKEHVLTLLHVLHHFLKRILRQGHLIILGVGGCDIEFRRAPTPH
jgi:DNA repair protein RadC